MKIYMKILLFCLLFHFLGCSTESNKAERTIEKIERDSIVRPSHVSTDAWLVNLGFVDKPVFTWVECIGNYSNNETIYPHIYQFRYWYDHSKDADTLNYEWNKGREQKTNFQFNDFKDYSYIPFPGDATIQLKNEEKELFLFNVVENHEFDRVFREIPYFRIPTVKVDPTYPEYGLSSDYSAEINIEQTQNGNYKVSLIDDKGIRTIIFKMNKGCTESTTKISYLNKENGYIYFIEEGCYLELVNKKDIDKI